MSTNTPIATLPYPSLSDAPNVPSDMQKLATALDSLCIPRYATPTARDQANTSPTAGQVCYVTSLDQLQRFRPGTGINAGWQRHSWNEAWGVVGGKRWTSGGAALSSGQASTEALTNMDTGSVTLLPGRDNRFVVRVNVISGGSGTDYFQFRVRRNSLSGLIYGDYILTIAQNTYGVSFEFSVDVPDIGASITDTFVLTCQRIGGSDTLTINRGGATSPTWMLLEDRGPASHITAV